MVSTFLKVYMELGSYFLFLKEQIKDIIISYLRYRTSGWRIDRVSVVIADGANHEFMIYHELFGGLSIMSLS